MQDMNTLLDSERINFHNEQATLHETWAEVNREKEKTYQS